MDGTKLADVQYIIEEMCLVCNTGLKICITLISILGAKYISSLKFSENKPV